MLIGKPFNHPAVLTFIRDHFGAHLALSHAWMVSGQSVPTRYEDLYGCAFREVRRLAGQIEPVGRLRTYRAIRASSAGRMRRRGGDYTLHLRTATTKDWKHHLSTEHLTLFRIRHGEIIRALGYPVV